MNTMNTKSEKGMVLIWFLLLMIVLLITSGAIYALSFQEFKLVTIDKYRNQAFYLAEAGLDKKLREIRSSNFADIASTTSPFSDGSYQVTYDAPTKMITSTGTYHGVSRIVKAKVTKTLPPGAKAALSSEGNISFLGNINVDGRDHNSSDGLTGDPGTYGASSGGTISQGGSSDIGGNGIAPADPANPATIEQNQTNNQWTTPEQLLGVATGSLDSYKTSNPPGFPMSGIVYYTGDSLIAPDFGSNSNPSTGVLIIHNANANALLKNAHGTFKGIIIADNVVHINGNALIVGGVIAKTSSQTTGDGSAQIHYSSSVLTNLPTSQYSLVSWEDTQNTAYTYS